MIKIKNHHTFYIGMLIVYMYGQCRKDLQEINWVDRIYFLIK